MSYRVLAKRYREPLSVKVSPSSPQRMVIAVAGRSKSLAEMSQELQLDMWRGYALADDKHVSVGGRDMAYYLAVDKTGF